MPVEPITGLPYPSAADSPAGAAQLMQLVTALGGSSGNATPVLRAVDAADRDTRYGGALTPSGVLVVAGQVVWLKIDTTGTPATDWKTVFDGSDDTGWVAANTAGFTPAAPNFATLAGTVRRRRGLVTVAFTIITNNAIAAGNSANVDMINVPVAYQPGGAGPVQGGAYGGSWQGQVNGNVISLGSTTSGFSAGDIMSVVGTYML